MILIRTPFRISFCGGGTDLQSFYSKEQGRVISSSINKYLYIAARKQTGIAEHKYRINWSQVEKCNKIEDIEHPIVREAFKLFNIDYPIEITTFSDIPANTGLGSSSAFSVGLVHALYTLQNKMPSKGVIANKAAQIEINLLKRNMGKQDHYASSYGGLNTISFNADESVLVEPIALDQNTYSELEGSLMLFYTYQKRDASEVLKFQNSPDNDQLEYLRKMKKQVLNIQDLLIGGGNINEFGKILDQAWQHKVNLNNEVGTDLIHLSIKKAKEAGANGVKLLGAGAGGFILVCAHKEKHAAIKNALNDLYYLDFKLEKGGSRVTYYDNAAV